ncbi:hypothetical protein M2146_001168 [Lachnospiraceae bacterium PF1-22]
MLTIARYIGRPVQERNRGEYFSIHLIKDKDGKGYTIQVGNEVLTYSDEEHLQREWQISA